METKFLVLKWVSQNRGVMSKIARQVRPRVTPQYVSLVLRGERHNPTIERILREYGAPIR